MNQSFKNELTQLINKYGIDAEANTPDYLLAEYVVDVLSSHIGITKTRDEWKERPKAPVNPDIPKEVLMVADAVAKALGGNCTVEIIKAEPQRKRKNRKKKNHGKEIFEDLDQCNDAINGNMPPGKILIGWELDIKVKPRYKKMK